MSAEPSLVSREASGLRVVSATAVDKGPLRALHRTARGEIGGPILKWFANPPVWTVPVAGIVPLFGMLLAWSGGLWLIAVAGPPLLVAYALFLGSLAVRGVGTVGTVFLVLGLATLLLMTAAAVCLLFLFALRWTRGAVLRRFARWSFQDIVFASVFVIAIPAVFFAVVSALLVHSGHLGVKGIGTNDSALPWRTFERYEWSLADSIPLLKIPDTLHWNPKLRFPTMAGGSLVLLFKLLLVLPLAELIGTALSSAFGADGERETERPRDSGRVPPS